MIIVIYLLLCITTHFDSGYLSSDITILSGNTTTNFKNKKIKKHNANLGALDQKCFIFPKITKVKEK